VLDARTAKLTPWVDVLVPYGHNKIGIIKALAAKRGDLLLCDSATLCAHGCLCTCALWRNLQSYRDSLHLLPQQSSALDQQQLNSALVHTLRIGNIAAVRLLAEHGAELTERAELLRSDLVLERYKDVDWVSALRGEILKERDSGDVTAFINFAWGVNWLFGNRFDMSSIDILYQGKKPSVTELYETSRARLFQGNLTRRSSLYSISSSDSVNIDTLRRYGKESRLDDKLPYTKRRRRKEILHNRAILSALRLELHLDDVTPPQTYSATTGFWEKGAILVKTNRIMDRIDIEKGRCLRYNKLA
jgi:hypothetical protein